MFVPVNRENTFVVFPAECNADQGTFSIAKIPTGSYVVCIQQNDSHSSGDLLNLAFDPAHSTLKREVAHDGQNFSIDLPKDLPDANRPAMPQGNSQ